LTDARPDVVFVVVDNNGGGLFDLLPQAQHATEFERLFITPHNLDLAGLAAFHNLGYDKVSALPDLGPAIRNALSVGGVSMVHVPVSRSADLSVRSDLDEIARAVVSDLDGKA
jgi:2-succinyl-5-enolpyruvyl-6-hydroxy-3-cyclohexene-1-carboxylate synthase